MSGHNNDIDDLLPLYVLGVLTPEEKQRVEAHLQEDPTAREYVARMRPVATALALSAEPVTVSPNVKKELFERIASQRSPSENISRRFSLRERLRRTVNFQPMLVTTTLILAMISLAWVLILSARLTLLRNEVSRLQATLASQQQVILQLADPLSKSIAIAGTDRQPDAYGRFIFKPGSQEGVVIIMNLQPLPADQVYQLWLIKGDTPESAGIFTVDAKGQANISVQATAAISDYETLGVSIEPKGGSQQPTGEIVVLSYLSQDV